MSKNNNSIFQYFDFFQMPISLSFKGNITYQTNFGGVLTIIGIIIIILLSIFGIEDLISKRHFSIVLEEYEDLNEPINLTNIPFAFILTDSQGQILKNDSKLFTIKIFHIKTNNDDIIEETNIEFSSCKNYINDLIEIKRYNLDNYICINPKQNLLLKGRKNNLNEYQTIKIYINKCDNKSNNCYEHSYIDKKLSNAIFKFYYLGYYINQNENKINTNLYCSSMILSINYIKQFSYILQKVNFILSDSFPRKSKQSNFYIFKEYNLDIEDKTLNTSSLIACLNFDTNGYIIKLTKKLKNLWDTLFEIGGLLNIILGILKILYNYVAKKILMFDIFENFDEIESNNEKKLQNVSRVFLANENKINTLKNNANKRRRVENYCEFKLNDNSNVLINKSSNILNVYNENAISPICKKVKSSHYNTNNKIQVKNFVKFNLKVTTPILKTVIPENQKIFIYLCPTLISRKAHFINDIFNSWDKIVQRISIENFLKLNTIETLIHKIKENNMRMNSMRNSIRYSMRNSVRNSVRNSMVIRSPNNLYSQNYLQIKQ